MTLCGWPDVKLQEHTNCHFLVAEYRQKRLAFWVCVASVGNQQRRWEVSVQRPGYHSVRWSIWTNRLPSTPHRPCASQGHLVSVTNLNKCGLRKFMLLRSVPLRRDASHAGSELGNHSDRKSDYGMLWQKWRLILRRWRLAANVGGWVTEETVTQTILLCAEYVCQCAIAHTVCPKSVHRETLQHHQQSSDSLRESDTTSGLRIGTGPLPMFKFLCPLNFICLYKTLLDQCKRWALGLCLCGKLWTTANFAMLLQRVRPASFIDHLIARVSTIENVTGRAIIPQRKKGARCGSSASTVSIFIRVADICQPFHNFLTVAMSVWRANHSPLYAEPLREADVWMASENTAIDSQRLITGTRLLTCLR